MGYSNIPAFSSKSVGIKIRMSATNFVWHFKGLVLVMDAETLA